MLSGTADQGHRTSNTMMTVTELQSPSQISKCTLTMCRKSRAVALCRSQFSLSRMILSILRISDGEQPQLLEAASSFKEGTR